jgi:hypothetical protein
MSSACWTVGDKKSVDTLETTCYIRTMKTTRQSMSAKPETTVTVEAYKRRYRELQAQQRALPLSEQWTMGAALRDAKARAYVAIEALRFGQ